MKRLIRRRPVEALTGLSRSALYEQIAKGAFPKPVRLGARSVAWVASEVEDWIEKRINDTRKGHQEKAGKGKK